MISLRQDSESYIARGLLQNTSLQTLVIGDAKDKTCLEEEIKRFKRSACRHQIDTSGLKDTRDKRVYVVANINVVHKSHKFIDIY